MSALRFVEIDGHTLEVLDIPALAPQQHSPPLVLLHEGLGCVAMWRDFPQQLHVRTGRRVVAYSRRGYGGSTPHPHGARNVYGADYMQIEAIEVAPKVFSALKIEKPVLIGHSDGATIALIFAATFPSALSKLCVMAPHVFVEDISVRSISEARIAFETTDLLAKLAKYHADAAATFYGWNDVWLSDAFRAFNICAMLPNISAPTLAVQGEGDAYGTMRQIDEIGLKVPSVQIVKLCNCGHAPWREQAATVLSDLSAFLS